MYNISESFETISNHIDHLDDYIDILEINEIEDKILEIQKKITTKRNYIFFDNDVVLSSININEEIYKLLNELNIEFWVNIFDEIVIVKNEKNEIKPIYYFSKNNLIFRNKTIDQEFMENILNEIIINMDFFIKNVIKNWGISDWEVIMATNQVWKTYDLIMKIWDYIIWFNNTKYSILQLNDNNKLFDTKLLIKKLDQFKTNIKKLISIN